MKSITREIGITISDADRSVDYCLSVKFEVDPGEPPTGPTYSCGGTPGYGPCLDIERVLCQEIVVWLGKQASSAFPGNDDNRSLESEMGEWCLEKYPAEIEQACWDWIEENERTDEFDPTDERI